jgi:sodium transport system ATP-binding protein
MIRVESLAKKFGAIQAVVDVSFEAENGRITGLLGPNGAGKTTTLRMISTLVAPSAGSARVDDCDVRADPLAARARLGMLTDARGLYSRLTARENIAYYGQLRGMSREALAASIARLSDWLELGSLLDRRTDGFSQGEKMKVAIARSLVHDPPNVVLDEPTNGLDVMTTRNLRDVIRRLRDEGKCVLFSSHVMQEVTALCDVIVIMAHGVVAARGTAAELLATSGATNLEDAFVALTGEPLPA